MYKSQYIKQKEADEIQQFQQEQKKQSLQKLFDQFSGNTSEIEKLYSLTEEEKTMLKDIKEEQENQAKMDGVFLKAFREN